MIYLFVDDSGEEPELQKALVEKGLDFRVAPDILVYGLTPPYLLVDGVPLDEERSWKWLKEK